MLYYLSHLGKYGWNFAGYTNFACENRVKMGRSWK